MTDAFCSFVHAVLDGEPIAEVAPRVGVTDQTIKNWLDRKNVPSAKVWATFLNRLGVPTEEKTNGWAVWAGAARVQAEGQRISRGSAGSGIKKVLSREAAGMHSLQRVGSCSAGAG